MNLYKFTFDLKGSSNLMQTVTIPTDSKYSVGIKICDGENEVVLDDTMKLTIQDDKFIYTPTEIFNNYAVFACKTDSVKGTTKTYQVNFHKDGSEPVEIWSKTYTFDGQPRSTYFTADVADFVDMLGDDVEKWDLHKFTRYCDYSILWKNGYKLSENIYAAGSVSVYLTKFPPKTFTIASAILDSKRNVVIFPGQCGDKYGWVIYDQSKADQDVTIDDIITTGKFSDYGVDISSFYMMYFASGVSRPAGDYNERVTYGDAIPEFNQIFRGFNVKTNDSKIANWAITDSQMKIVYTNEWPELSATADDRLIYFVVDRPRPPKPVPPKPTPGGDVKWGVLIGEVEESATFDPTNINDCLEAYPDKFVKYTRDGIDYYLQLVVNSSPSAEKREEEDAVRVDQIALAWQEYLEDDIHLQLETMYVKDGQLNVNSFNKHFNTEDEMYDYEDNYLFSRFGEDEDQPNTSNPIPADFDTWEIVDEYAESLPIANETDEYVFVEGIEDVNPSMKLFKNMDTFVQWQLVGPD